MQKVIIVNKKDEVIGAEDIRIALESEHIRRISRILVLNRSGQIFLQRRSKDKIIAPDCWDLSAGGHVDKGETYEEAARRELKEELGVSGTKLLEVAHFYLEEPYKDKTAKQFNTLYKTVFDGLITPDKEELSGGKWFSLSEVKDKLQREHRDIAPGLRRLFEEYDKSLS